MPEEIQPRKPAARISNTLLEEETVETDFEPHTRKRKSLENFRNEPNNETAIALNSKTPYTEIAKLKEKVKSNGFHDGFQ